MDRPWSENARGEVILRVLVKPMASKSRVLETSGGELVVQVAAPPVEGAANDELIRFLARHLGLSRSRVRLLKGETSRHKVLLLHSVELLEIEARLKPP